MATDDELIEASSLGTPGARSLRARATGAEVSEVMRRVRTSAPHHASSQVDGDEPVGSVAAPVQDPPSAVPQLPEAPSTGEGVVGGDGLTARQRLVLDTIRILVERRGYSPSLREIGEAVGLTSASAVSHDNSRYRILAAFAAVEAAERECLRAACEQVSAVGEEAGVGPGMLVVFHAVPRSDTVWSLDGQDCSSEDAVLRAVDFADVTGRRFRLTQDGLAALAPNADPPGGSAGQTDPAAARAVPALGGRLWQRAVLTWVDLHRALTTWTGRRLAASLVVAPETGDVASLEPVCCPDRGQDFEVVTSLRFASEQVAEADLDAARVSALGDPGRDTADLVELDLRRWLDAAMLKLPGFPAHPIGECSDTPIGEIRSGVLDDASTYVDGIPDSEIEARLAAGLHPGDEDDERQEEDPVVGAEDDEVTDERSCTEKGYLSAWADDGPLPVRHGRFGSSGPRQ